MLGSMQKKLSIKRTLQVCTLSAITLVSCGKNEKTATQAPAPAVSVYQVVNAEVGHYQEFVARTEASKIADLTARVEGELIERHFDEGHYVEKGKLLLKIDPAAYQASVLQAKAELASALSGFDNAERNLKRAKELINDGYISQSDFDRLTTEESQAKAQVSNSQAAVEKAELNLSYTSITAPFSGRIGKVNFNVGNIVGPTSQSLATLTLTDPVYVNFQLQEKDYITLIQNRGNEERPDDLPITLSLRLPNNSLYDQQGKLNFADTKIDQGMGTVELRATFPNPDDLILPGLFVTLVIESTKKRQMVYVPQAAVQENQQGKFVLVVDDNETVLQRHVTLGRRVNAMWVVETGLEEGERVIVEGLQKVRNGVEVNAVEKLVDAVTGTISEPAAK